MKNLSIITHPIAATALAQLRNREIGHDKFRFHSDALCKILIAESALDLESEDNVVVIPILRAGIAMLNAALQEFPTARVGFVGLARDEKTAVAEEYYWKLPKLDEDTTIIILDPMLATGGSISHVLKKLQTSVFKEIRIISVISAPEGVQKIHNDFPNIKIFTGALDTGLDKDKYIVPGLGDFGDRYFGTQ